jgi:carboxypeptidase T
MRKSVRKEQKAMTHRRFTWLSALAAVLILASLAAPGSLAGATPAKIDEAAVVRLYYTDRAHLDAVAGELDIWEVHSDEGYVVAAVQPATYQWLQGLGYRLEIDAEKTALLGIQAPLDPRFYYFDDYYSNSNGLYIVNFLQDTNTAYPNLTELYDIGNAWAADNGGYHRDMWVLRITNEDPAYGPIEDKPVFYLFANIHAREVATPELAIRYIKYLTSGYDSQGGYDVDPDVTWLVNHNVAYVLVTQNPDGRVMDEQSTSAMWRKNVDSDDGCGDPSSWGVDLNRNHSFMWGCCGGSSGSPCSETYRGPERDSEPETIAFQEHFASVVLDQNGPNGDDEIPPAAPITTTGIFITLHSYSDLVLWPWGHTTSQAPNAAGLQTIGRKFAYYNNFTPQQAYQLYATDGTTDDWTYGKFGIASYTFEVGPSGGSCGGFFPAYECMDGTAGYPQNFWAENKPAFLFAHKIARTPYITAYGPDTQDVAVAPDSVPQGTPVGLTANIADHRYGADPLQPIFGAEYFLDAPGDDGTGMAMSPSDGSWGGLSEDVEATVDTSALAPGKHSLRVHGLNDDGDWGPFTAVFVTTTPGTPPDIISLEAAPASIPIVYGQSTVTATLTLSDSTPAPGWLVTFTTDLGTLDPSAAYADANGQAVTTLTAGATAGTAHVGAEAASLVGGPVEVEFYVPEAPAADFSSAPACVGAPLAFTNLSTYPPEVPVGYLWDFGDGVGSSTDENPFYTYATGGEFTVSLAASNVGGSDTVTHTAYVTPTPTSAFTFSPAYPRPGQAVHFYDASSDNPSAWSWTLGYGGSGSSLQNPVYSYPLSGTYTVTLQARNQCGWGTTYSQAIQVGAEPPRFRIYLPLVVRDGS